MKLYLDLYITQYAKYAYQFSWGTYYLTLDTKKPTLEIEKGNKVQLNKTQYSCSLSIKIHLISFGTKSIIYYQRDQMLK